MTDWVDRIIAPAPADRRGKKRVLFTFITPKDKNKTGVKVILTHKQTDANSKQFSGP